MHIKEPNMSALENNIASLGLSEKEASAYVELVRLGPTAASTLSKRIGANRTAMYDVLGKLEDKGLIASFRKNNTTFFAVEDLESLIVRQKSQLTLAEKIVEELAQLHAFTGFGIQYYVGAEGIKKLFEEILEESPTQLDVWMNTDSFESILENNFLENWIAERVRKGIFTRMLQTDSQHARSLRREDKNKKREIRFIEHMPYSFASVCYLFNHSVVLFDLSEKKIGIRINSKEITTMFLQIFNITWKLGT